MDIRDILVKHQAWLNDDGGAQADLRDANLRDADLRSADLRGANLRDAYLRNADLRDAYLRGADLRGADLRDAYLRGADLRGADLRDATGNMREIKNMHVEKYPIAYTAEILQIGCEQHPIADWWGFDDERIKQMDGEAALKWWRKWIYVIKQTIELSPATNQRKQP